MQRLRKNNGRYQGECIEIDQVLREIEQLAAQSGWERETLLVSQTHSLPAFRRTASSPGQRIYISTGIHGDEPAGPLAALKLFQENQWPESISLWLIPCLNPVGYVRNCRENEDGFDLNRDYRS